MTALRTGFLCCLVWSLFLPSVGGAQPVAKLSADIGPRPVSEALAAFGRQTGVQLIYVSSVAETQLSKGAGAGLAAPEALAQLLDGTGLSFEFLNARTVRIFEAPIIVPTQTTSTAELPRRAVPRALGLEEVVVSGARGLEPVSRVPIAMIVWTERDMQASHVKGIAQIAMLTPGVDFGFSPGIGDEYTDLVIRGVAARHGATAGVLAGHRPPQVVRPRGGQARDQVAGHSSS